MLLVKTSVCRRSSFAVAALQPIAFAYSLSTLPGIFHLANGIKGQVAEAEFEPDDVPNVFKNMFDIQVAEDIWQWARGPLYLGLYTGATEDNRDPRRYPGTL